MEEETLEINMTSCPSSFSINSQMVVAQQITINSVSSRIPLQMEEELTTGTIIPSSLNHTRISSSNNSL
jgi:hypothetical protein